MNSFREIIQAWPTSDALAKDLGLDQQTVQKWKNRDSLLPKYWRDIRAAGAGRNIIISLDDMCEAAERGK